MRHPRLIILESDGWLARQLAELAGESRWLVHTPRSADAALTLVREPGPAVLLVQLELADDATDRLALVADAHRLAPDVPLIAVSDAKLSDPDRAAWTAVLFDLGARLVLFPPITGPVLEDAVSGLLGASVRRTIGGEPPPPRPPSDVIDLADEEAHG